MGSIRRAAGGLVATAVALLLLAPSGVHAQRTVVWDEVFTNGELERYLRVLQLTGDLEVYPWSVRGLSPVELERLELSDSTHPWADRYELKPKGEGLEFSWVRPELGMIYNSAFPHGTNDGAIWAGRGLTTSLQAGFAARFGPLSLVVAPIAFRAENEDFELVPSGSSSASPYGSPYRPTVIDLPQRFGEEPYARIDPGQSTLRIDAFGLALGASTANHQWGPGQEHPLVLGSAAAGFPHLFASTAAPVNIAVGSVHGRIIWGRLDQSAYSPVRSGETRRLGTGLVGVFSPHGLESLEIGATRFFHVRWPSGGPSSSDILLPFQSILKENLTEDEQKRSENQIASVFARWVLPKSGFEINGEYYREDHSGDLRDLLLEPDHISAYTVGIQKTLWHERGQIAVLRAELINSRITHLNRVRSQVLPYTHSVVRQGHTHLGQVLASPGALGGAASLLATDVYQSHGRWSASWRRTVLPHRAGHGGHSAQHEIAIEGVRRWGHFELTGRLSRAYRMLGSAGAGESNFNLVIQMRFEGAY